MLTRRGFLGLGGAAVAAMTLDPERLLWVPGAKTFFLPSTEIVTAATLDEAVQRGFIALFPPSIRMEVRVCAGLGMTLDERLALERRDVARLGGRIVENRQWKEVTSAVHQS